ncbi:putative aminopeptidase W07G4.4 [Coccinella septempunctata]|uniref:putative aminopeptidase W07G4.4 n=1 Tax=Coccinella septempunctata TaxID=41139 RepID=UPI001D062C7E|nr:putative aminopeptidase W07G4.4 [Coccinella septempunctata]
MTLDNGVFSLDIRPVEDLNDPQYDGIILVVAPDQVDSVEEFSGVVKEALALDATLKTEVGVLAIPQFNAKRLIYAPTGAIDVDYDDVRCFRRAGLNAIKRACKAGVKNPLVYILGHPDYKNAALVTLLGVLEGLYVPIQIREFNPSKLHSIQKVGVYGKQSIEKENLINLAKTLEYGRRVACDIGDGDPERMAPPKVEEYITKLFSGTDVSVSVVKDEDKLRKEYPLFEAVNRAASNIKRHQGRIIFLEYKPKGEITKTVFLVGKGVTYDTGGADVKAGGVMAGMSRDKCGAAAVAGFFQVLSLLKPKSIRVVGGLSMVRNSIGSNGYVSDELITARSGKLVRVGNTDAEGRMVMADVLCKFKEMALEAVDPHLYTVATLTGHACLTVGVGYSIVMDNGPARKAKHAECLTSKGEEISEPFEISTIRKEDLEFHKGQAVGDDILQCNNLPSSRTARGHQGPGAFLILAAGLSGHGSGDAVPLKYSHLDIAASAGDFPNPATGAPVLALANKYLL